MLSKLCNRGNIYVGSESLVQKNVRNSSLSTFHQIFLPWSKLIREVGGGEEQQKGIREEMFNSLFLVIYLNNNFI